MNNTSTPIKGLQQLLAGTIPEGSIVQKYTTAPLLEPGENYGSLLYSATVIIEDKLKTETELHLVAKLLPNNEWIRKQFVVDVTFKREIAMYKVIAPALINFQAAQGISSSLLNLPKIYGARTSLDPNSSALDNDAVILLENLKLSGFSTFDRMKGFDYGTTISILKSLAGFHAVTIAFKTLQPETFLSLIQPHLGPVEVFSAVSSGNGVNVIQERLLTTALLNEECRFLIPNVRNAIEFSKKYSTNGHVPNGPFVTMIHNDFWLNNIMIKLIDNKAAQCVFIDFQTIMYDSACNDIILFLYTSVKKTLLDLHFDDFLSHYLTAFTAVLESFKCDVTTYTYTLLLQELRKCAKINLLRILFMQGVVYGAKGQLKSVEEINESHLGRSEFATEEYLTRIPEIILDFYHKGWI